MDREQLLDDLLRCYMEAAVDRLLAEPPKNEEARRGVSPDGPRIDSTGVTSHGHSVIATDNLQT